MDDRGNGRHEGWLTNAFVIWMHSGMDVIKDVGWMHPGMDVGGRWMHP